MSAILSALKSIFSFFKSLISKLVGSSKDDIDPIGQEIVDYYGCPNSKKAAKLQLKETRAKSIPHN